MQNQNKEEFYEHYFPDFDQVNLEMESLLKNVTKELEANFPIDKNSTQAQKSYEMLQTLHIEEVNKLQNDLSKLDAPHLLEYIETVENWNLKLIAEYKQIL